jgi:hypothetical protein
VNLASLSKFLNKGAILHGEGRVLTLSKEGETFLQANNQNDLMVIQTANKPGPRAFMASEAEKAELWHRRFGHAGLDSLAKMAQEGFFEGMPVRTESFKKIRDEVCEPCVLGKQTKKSFPTSKRESQGPMDVIHTDVCGPIQTKTPGGRRYFVSFTDDYSRSAFIQLLSNKNQVQDALEAFVNTMETQFDKKVKAIQSDRGGEFWNREMTKYCKSKGIIHRKSLLFSREWGGRASEQNTYGERKSHATRRWVGDRILGRSCAHCLLCAKSNGLLSPWEDAARDVDREEANGGSSQSVWRHCLCSCPKPKTLEA